MTPSDASTPFWDAAEAPEGLGGTQEPTVPFTNESASEAASLAILPAAPVAAAPQADVGRVEPVSVQDTPTTANDGSCVCGLLVWLLAGSVGLSVGWFAGWLVGLCGWLVGWLAVWLVGMWVGG